VSFQITVLKVLAGSKGGHLPLADLRRDVAILISSGTDWTNRTKRLASRAPGLDIFSQALVLRDPNGWRITDAGRALLAELEAPAAISNAHGPALHIAEPPPADITSPSVPSVVTNTRRSRRRRRSASRKPPSRLLLAAWKGANKSLRNEPRAIELAERSGLTTHAPSKRMPR
jgi:hypothetical protein